MTHLRTGEAARIWTRQLITLAAAVFFINFGQGLFNGAGTNFYVQTLGLSGAQVLWLAGIREIPGLLLIFIAAVFMHLPLTWGSAASVVLMAVGYGLYAAVNSYLALIAVALIGSLGFHYWMPLSGALAMGLIRKEHSGRVMGALAAVRALASIVGVGAIALTASLWQSLALRSYYILGGALTCVAAILILRLPKESGVVRNGQRRLLLRRRYWLYYVLTFFEGSRVQVFHAFGTLVLVDSYGLAVWQISLLLLVSGGVNLLLSPMLGRLLDDVGERLTLTVSYVALALCFVGYATIHSAWMLGLLLVCINLLTTLSMGLSTYVNRISPSEELTPTLSAGVSINHVTSVGMSLVAGSLLAIIGYEGLCWGAAAVILASVPFALAIRTEAVETLQPQPVAAK